MRMTQQNLAPLCSTKKEDLQSFSNWGKTTEKNKIFEGKIRSQLDKNTPLNQDSSIAKTKNSGYGDSKRP